MTQKALVLTKKKKKLNRLPKWNQMLPKRRKQSHLRKRPQVRLPQVPRKGSTIWGPQRSSLGIMGPSWMTLRMRMGRRRRWKLWSTLQQTMRQNQRSANLQPRRKPLRMIQVCYMTCALVTDVNVQKKDDDDDNDGSCNDSGCNSSGDCDDALPLSTPSTKFFVGHSNLKWEYPQSCNYHCITWVSLA